LKTKLTEKSLRQICGVNKVPLSSLSRIRRNGAQCMYRENE